MKNVTLLCLVLLAFNSFAQDCNPEFSYDKNEYCSNEGIITPNHDTGIDGIYTYTTILGGTLTIDSLTGVIDLGTSETGIYRVTNYVATDICALSIDRDIEVINDNTPPIIVLDDFSATVNPWNCLGDFSMPDPVITDESESQILFTLEGPEGSNASIIPPNTPMNSTDFYLVFGLEVGEHIFTFSASDPCGNSTTKEVIVTVLPMTFNPGNSVVVDVELYYTNFIAKVFANDITSDFDGCQVVKLEVRRDTDACNIDGNSTYNDDGHSGDGSSDSNAIDYDPDNGEFISICLADIDTVDSNGDEYGSVPILLRAWIDNNNSGVFGDFIDQNNDGDVTDIGEFDNFNDQWHTVEVRKNPLFNQVICPSDITLNCNSDYTSLALESQIIIPDTINNGEYTVSYTPQLNTCSEGNVTATYTIGDSVYCNRTITMVNPFPTFEFDPSMIPDITIDCGDTISNLLPITSGPCDFIGYTADLDTVVRDSVNGTMLIENNYTLIDWCVYDSTDGQDGLYLGTQNVGVVDTIAPFPLCQSLATLNTAEFPTTVSAQSFNFGGYDECTESEDLRYTFSNIPPSLDPTFDESINSSTKNFTHGNTNPLDTIHLKVYIWDLANNSNFCIIVVSLNPANTSIQCPADITLSCDQDYTDLLITGVPNIPDSLDLGTPSVSYTPTLDACGVGSVLATFIAGDSIICTQTITIENPFPPFDPTTIVMPENITITDCSLADLQAPSWIGGPCDFIGYTADTDTLEFNDLGEFKLERSYTVIDWCLYDATDGAEGLYSGSHFVTVIDDEAPTPFCLSAIGINAADLPTTIEASFFNLGSFDNCTPDSRLRFTFSDVLTQFDPNYNSATRTSTRLITENDFADSGLSLDIYYWDLADNSDFCTVSISLLTSTEDIDHNQISISKNHPNPFSEITTIEFDLKESTDVSITVYDISGNEYISVTEYYPAGFHSRSIDLTDAPTGALLYRLTTNQSSVSGKMIKI